MGLSVFNQVDNSKYFALSTIDKKAMEKHGITLSKAKFLEIARRSPPYTAIITGSDRITGQCRRTKIYRYEDFSYLKEGGDINAVKG